MGCFIKSVWFVHGFLPYVGLWWISCRMLWHYHFMSNCILCCFMHRFPMTCQMIDIYNAQRPSTVDQWNINLILQRFEAPLKQLAIVPDSCGHGPTRVWFAPNDVEEASALLNWNKLVFKYVCCKQQFPRVSSDWSTQERRFPRLSAVIQSKQGKTNMHTIDYVAFQHK